MMPEIIGADGKIETLITLPKEMPVAVAIVCHPHPLQEGTMHNKVVTTLAKAYDLCQAITIRFNFRGVGQSDGVFDHARGECDDLRAVIAFAKKQYPALPIWLGGFSFGSYIAARVANEDHTIANIVSIAPPVERANEYDFNAVQNIQQPWLIVQGDQDEIVSFEATLAWWNDRKMVTPHQELKILQNTGHFFHRRLIELRSIVSDWINSL